MLNLFATWTIPHNVTSYQKEKKTENKKPVSFWFGLTSSFTPKKPPPAAEQPQSQPPPPVFVLVLLMSTEQEILHSESDAVDDCKASRVEVGMSELPADPLSGQDQGLAASSAGGDLGITKEKESVNGGLDLDLETQNDVDVKTNKEVSVNGEKDSGGIQTELLVEKEVEGSDGSVKKGRKGENLDDMECFMGLEPHESKDESALENENDAPVTLKAKLSDSDLVWAKVRSHPWWPGQVFDASAATDKAKKHFKKGSFLVTYFGDCSFAWNDASKIKPFRQHFSQLAKQSSLPDFVDAVDFSLEEVSRRIEFGLACSCISEEVYEKVKTQKIINPGIREDSSRIQGGDKVSSAVFFEPKNLVSYVKRLACSPKYDASDELEFVSQRARLLAFSRWKGYTELPEFETLKGSVESAPKVSRTEKESRLSEVKKSAPEPKKDKQVYTKRRKTEGQDDCKQEGVFEYEDATVPKKREKTLAEFIAEKRLSKSNGKKRSHENAVVKPDGEKKRKIVQSKLPKSAKKIKTTLQAEDSGSPISPKNDQKITPKKARTSFGIGASILRVANQMHSSTPTGLVPCSKNSGSGKSLQNRRKPVSSSETPNGKANPISIGKPQSGELEHAVKETASTNIVEESMLKESRDLKGSSEEQMVNEDGKEAANVVGEMSTDDSNLTKEKITGSVLKEEIVNKNCSEGSVGCKEVSPAE
ncbi:unnamed protein product [Eruca vesicaria subsp. sativa]|uniref:PWWP domain-containing protein n=1 Tax=Eruca vesicaria subsp. sativa TaxID=29727 RepID=A0ABC8KA09_ERUVS|nr:unnamed protein product [Eruca vesicaria subsp. sativa]